MNKKYRLELRVAITEDGNYTNRLAVEESYDIGTLDFLDIAVVLGQFHALAGKVKAEAKA